MIRGRLVWTVLLEADSEWVGGERGREGEGERRERATSPFYSGCLSLSVGEKDFSAPRARTRVLEASR